MLTATQGGAVVISHNGNTSLTTKTGGFTTPGDITAATFTGNITGNVTGASSQISVEDESVDTSCNVVFTTAPSGNLAPKTGTNLTFNSSTGALSATSFIGNGANLTSVPAGQVTGTLPAIDGSNLTDVNAAKIDLTATNSTNAIHYLTFVDTATGSEDLRTDTQLQWNPSTNILSATTFGGNCTGLTGNPNISVTDVTLLGNIVPDTDATRNLGEPSTRFQNVYTADLHFNNTGTGGNSVDGTEGNWTLQEGDENIFLLNNLSLIHISEPTRPY